MLILLLSNQNVVILSTGQKSEIFLCFRKNKIKYYMKNQKTFFDFCPGENIPTIWFDNAKVGNTGTKST